MSRSAERHDIKLRGGVVLHQLADEDRVFGYLAMEPDGRARVWNQVWWNEWAPTKHVFPGFVSAARAIIDGWV